MSSISLPADVEYVRTTPRFTEATVPAGLLGEHRVAEATWGVLAVHSGSLSFVFDEPAEDRSRRGLAAGDTQVIPPRRLHHLELHGPAEFDVAFYRRVSPGVGNDDGSTSGEV